MGLYFIKVEEKKTVKKTNDISKFYFKGKKSEKITIL